MKLEFDHARGDEKSDANNGAKLHAEQRETQADEKSEAELDHDHQP